MNIVNLTVVESPLLIVALTVYGVLALVRIVRWVLDILP